MWDHNVTWYWYFQCHLACATNSISIWFFRYSFQQSYSTNSYEVAWSKKININHVRLLSNISDVRLFLESLFFFLILQGSIVYIWQYVHTYTCANMVLMWDHSRQSLFIFPFVLQGSMMINFYRIYLIIHSCIHTCIHIYIYIYMYVYAYVYLCIFGELNSCELGVFRF